MYIRWLGITVQHVVELPPKNYNGTQFAAALELAMNTPLPSLLDATFENSQVYKVEFDNNDNLIIIKQIGGFLADTTLVSSADLLAGINWDSKISSKSLLKSMNGILRIGKQSFHLGEGITYQAYLDLHTTRNLYLASSTLASYTSISNFGNDVIVKKIPVHASPGQMMFYNATTGYDYLEVSKRSFSRIDFRLTDSFGNLVNLRGNHWSFSMVFQLKQ
jgi:hypothetical protein